MIISWMLYICAHGSWHLMKWLCYTCIVFGMNRRHAQWKGTMTNKENSSTHRGSDFINSFSFKKASACHPHCLTDRQSLSGKSETNTHEWTRGWESVCEWQLCILKNDNNRNVNIDSDFIDLAFKYNYIKNNGFNGFIKGWFFKRKQTKLCLALRHLIIQRSRSLYYLWWWYWLDHTLGLTLT